MKNTLNPKAFALALAAVAFIMDLVGYIWHGLLRQPSAMDLIYPGFWSNWGLLIAGLAGTVAGAYVLGYIFASIYNKFCK